MNMTKKSILICLLLTVSLSVAAEDRNMTPSPDSTMVAFTRGNDLWVRCLADSSETRLTSDGTELILNGYASWVYYEEIFGRESDYRAFWWSPDSRSIAYYRFDNTEVPVFPIFSPFGQNGSLSMTRYPKAGQTNPSVRVGIVSLGSGETTWARFDYSEDQYFGTPFWSPDSRELFVPREPRRQNTLELFAVNASDGGLREVYREEYPTWVEWIDDMLFTDDGFYMARDFAAAGALSARPQGEGDRTDRPRIYGGGGGILRGWPQFHGAALQRSHAGDEHTRPQRQLRL